MNQKVIIGLLAALAGVIVVYIYFSPSGMSAEEYIASLRNERKEKNNFMATSEESPFHDDPGLFHELLYFEPDPLYKVTADLAPVTDKKVVMLATSTGEQGQYLEYGWAEFSLQGKTFRLLILESMSMGPTRGTLFLAFTDETSAKETYGAGRYLDLKKIPGATTITLDFNKAYNPYCAYVNNFSCPFPPKENNLPIAIRAGEKNYH